MDIKGMISDSMIEVGAELSTKDEALDRLVTLQKNSGRIHSSLALRREIDKREKIAGSAVACRVAIPAVSYSGARKTCISAVTVRDGVEYGAPDQRKVRLIFLIAGKGGTDEYIEAKSRLMRLLSDAEFSACLCAARSREEFLDILLSREEALYPKPQKRYANHPFSGNRKTRRGFRKKNNSH